MMVVVEQTRTRIKVFHICDSYDIAIHCAAITGGIEGTTYNAATQSSSNAQLDGAFFEWVLRTRPGRSVYFSSSFSRRDASIAMGIL
jgi:hypothetical protein